jgi:hypothetical protein
MKPPYFFRLSAWSTGERDRRVEVREDYDEEDLADDVGQRRD